MTGIIRDLAGFIVVGSKLRVLQITAKIMRHNKSYVKDGQQNNGKSRRHTANGRNSYRKNKNGTRASEIKTAKKVKLQQENCKNEGIVSKCLLKIFLH